MKIIFEIINYPFGHPVLLLTTYLILVQCKAFGGRVIIHYLRGFRPGPSQTGCRAIQDGLRLEILDLGSRGIVLNV